MNNPKSHALTGMRNERISKTTPSDHASTAAWTEADSHAPKSNVTIPGSAAVENAKEWVDNGSML